jgi:hypothetical protein
VTAAGPARGWVPVSSALPWRRPRRELLLLGLVAAAALTTVFPVGAQDLSRLCLTRSLVHARLSDDACLAGTLDRAEYGGHLYSDKAPGISVLSIPAAQVVRLPPPARWADDGEARLWFVRLTTGGLGLLICAFLVGRVAEGLSPGWGGACLVTFALGTVASGLAASSFEPVPAAAIAFGSFVLAWGRRPFASGLSAGLLVLVDYEAALIAVVVALYVLLAGGRALGRFALGVLPGLLLLGAYDWAAFGSPFHLSYRYVAPQFAAQQAAGFFGIHAPSAHGIRLVFVGNRGLLVDSPVVVLAAVGLALLWRGGRRAEAAVCALVTLALLALEVGYYDPYGGDSPGPRFFIPALPFLALGLAPAFARWRVPTIVLAAASVVASTAVAVTWPAAVNSASGYSWSVWRQLVGLVGHGAAAPIAGWVQRNVLSWAGVGRLGVGGFVAVFALGAFALAVRDGLRFRQPAA